MEKQKENVLKDFIEMIEKSWTYEKLTTTEKTYFYQAFFNDSKMEKALKGTYNQRWEILQLNYQTFLLALGYNYNPTWREEK